MPNTEVEIEIFCSGVAFAGSYWEPPEPCGIPAADYIEGEPYCERHPGVVRDQIALEAKMDEHFKDL